MVFSFPVARKRFHVVVEKQRERFVDAHRRKVTVSTLESEPETLREKAGRRLLVARRNDGVVDHDRHRPPPAGPQRHCLSMFRRPPHQRSDTATPSSSSASRRRGPSAVASGSARGEKNPCSTISRPGCGGVSWRKLLTTNTAIWSRREPAGL